MIEGTMSITMSYQEDEQYNIWLRSFYTRSTVLYWVVKYINGHYRDCLLRGTSVKGKFCYMGDPVTVTSINYRHGDKGHWSL